MATKQQQSAITASELAALVKRDPKVVRAYLRQHFARKPEQKNARWTITATVQKAVVEHFSALDAKSAAKAS